MRAVKPKGPSELNIQASFFEWVNLYKKQFSELDLFFSIPNEGNRSALNGWKRQLTGRRAGVPDVHLPVARHDGETVTHGLWIEFKSEKGTVSEVQKKWHGKLTEQYHLVVVCRSWVEAANITIAYLKLPLKPLTEMRG